MNCASHWSSCGWGGDGHPRVWELDRGVKGPPGATDKDGGGTIRVAGFYSNSLSVAETRHFFPHKQNI